MSGKERKYMRRIIKKLPVFCIIALVLVASFRWGESSPVTCKNEISQPQENCEDYEEPQLVESGEEDKTPDAELPAPAEKSKSAVEVSAQNWQLPQGKPALPEKNEKQEKSEFKEKLVCSLSVGCDTVFGNIDRLVPEKYPLIPPDGILYRKDELAFSDGDTVFDVLLREMTAAGIHMEFVKTPMYGNVYIEGIGNLYEFDCGELSGWMYRVNGIFPNFGCGGYKLSPGDKVEWVYTCNLGRDVGGDFSAQNGE